MNELVATVFLVGFVATAAALLVFVGGSLMEDVTDTARTEAATNQILEVSNRLHSVASGSGRTSATIPLDGPGEYSVDERGSVRFVVNGNASCSASVPLGSLQYDPGSDTVLAYEAGGVWRTTENGTTMVSPPDVQYEDGQLYFSITNVSGDVDGGGALTARRDVDGGRAGTEGIAAALYDDAACRPPRNVTVSVTSRFYDAWGRYFEDELNGSVAVFDGNRTTRVTLPLRGSTVTVDGANNTVSARTSFTGTVEVLGTELSGTGWGRVYYGPTTFVVEAGGQTLTPFPDGNVDNAIPPGNPAIDDVNDPTLGEHFVYELDTYSGGASITVHATSWECDSWEDSGRDVTVGGFAYDQYGCRVAGDERISISSTSQSSNLVLLRDGDRVPDFNEAGPEQRGLADILGDRINDSGYLHLADNEVVFLYELSEPNATPGSASGSGDPDYNDAVVLLTIRETGVGVPQNFAIRVVENEVVVEDA